MRKQLFQRGLLGAPIGVTIAVLVTIIESAIANSIAGGGANAYYPVVPEAVVFWGGELSAMTCVFVSSLLYGFVWGAISVIWDIPSWSLTRQTITHLAIAATATLGFLWVNFILPLHSVPECVLWFAIWAGIYACIWVFSWLRASRATKEVNAGLARRDPR